MRSISGMPSDELAGDALRRVPLQRGMPFDEMAGDVKRRVPIPCERRKGCCAEFCRPVYIKFY